MQCKPLWACLLASAQLATAEFIIKELPLQVLKNGAVNAEFNQADAFEPPVLNEVAAVFVPGHPYLSRTCPPHFLSETIGMETGSSFLSGEQIQTALDLIMTADEYTLHGLHERIHSQVGTETFIEAWYCIFKAKNYAILRTDNAETLEEYLPRLEMLLALAERFWGFGASNFGEADLSAITKKAADLRKKADQLVDTRNPCDNEYQRWSGFWSRLCQGAGKLGTESLLAKTSADGKVAITRIGRICKLSALVSSLRAGLQRQDRDEIRDQTIQLSKRFTAAYESLTRHMQRIKNALSPGQCSL
jgi:hypothetical protein